MQSEMTIRRATLVSRCACAFLLWSCAAQPVAPALITDPAAVEEHAGGLVTIRGILRSSFKGATVLGVGVQTELSSMDDTLVEATGVLRRWSVRAPASVWDSNATRYGSFFTLEDPRSPTRLATVSPVPPYRKGKSRSDEVLPETRGWRAGRDSRE